MPCLKINSKEIKKMNKWKITAIIFIIIAVLEFALICFSVSLAINQIENESDCSVNVCNNYESYIYDDYSKMCYCYNDGKVVYQEYIK